MPRSIYTSIGTLIIAFVLSFFIYPPFSNVYAVGDFSSDYSVHYAISPTGTTTVTQTITLTNLTTHRYSKEFSIVLDSSKVRNVIAYDGGGVITPEVLQKDGKTDIRLTFNDKVAGIGKTMQFTLRYDTDDIAIQQGQIWEVNIPGIRDDPSIQTYTVNLDVPGSFGPNAYTSPLPANGRQWTRDQLTHGGISAAYGTEQLYEAQLSYFLENNTNADITEDIALPPDTAFQKVEIMSIEPKPQSIHRDSDGNWLARFVLSRQSTIEVNAMLRVAVTLERRSTYASSKIDGNKYIVPLPYWDSQNPDIVELANNLNTVRDIYDYVVSTLTYNYNRIQTSPKRKGAVLALSEPSDAICTDFTDLFVSLARAKGIPAREVVGYAYTTNAKLRPLSLVADVLHAWPEYYDYEKEVWIPVDPTWANTTGGINYFDKLDFNHIVLAIHGQSSEKPYPAGYYKKSGKTTRDVNVRFAVPSSLSRENKLTNAIHFYKWIVSGFDGKGFVRIMNGAGLNIDEANISIYVAPMGVTLEKTIKNLTPFSSFDVPFTFDTSFTLAYILNGFILVNVNGELTRQYFSIIPFVYIFLLALILVVMILIITFWKLRRKR